MGLPFLRNSAALEVFKHVAAQVPQFLDFLIVLGVEALRFGQEVFPLVLWLVAVGFRIDCLVIVIGLLAFVVIVFDHAENAQKRVANDTEGLRFFLMLLAYLELDFLDGWSIPIRGIVYYGCCIFV